MFIQSTKCLNYGPYIERHVIYFKNLKDPNINRLSNCPSLNTPYTWQNTRNSITALLKNIYRYLNEAKHQHDLATDAALSQKLGVPPNHVFNWYNDVSHLNDEAAVKLARLLKVDPLEIIACANYHKVAKSTKRKQNPKKNAAQRKFWRQIYNEALRKK